MSKFCTFAAWGSVSGGFHAQFHPNHRHRETNGADADVFACMPEDAIDAITDVQISLYRSELTRSGFTTLAQRNANPERGEDGTGAT